MASSGLAEKVIENIFKKLADVAQKWYDFIDISFLPDELKERYKEEIKEHLFHDDLSRHTYIRLQKIDTKSKRECMLAILGLAGGNHLAKRVKNGQV